MKVWGEYWQGHMQFVRSTVDWGMRMCAVLSQIPLVGRFAMIGDDLLATFDHVVGRDNTDKVHLIFKIGLGN